MAHLHKKVKKGRPYYYIREIQRVGGKPKVISQIYLGSVDTIAKRIQQAEQARRPLRLESRSFGALFVALQLEKTLDTIGLIDRIVPRTRKEKGPTVGEYFFYAWANRLISPRSKRALTQWYRHTAIQQIRPVALEELTSQRYWEKWDRVQAEDVERIGQEFFVRVWKLQPLPPECLLFDTTNYYTFMGSRTDSELCERGHNKAGRHHLRQLGLALLVDRVTHLPLYYRVYEGNAHDSKLFRRTIDELFGVMQAAPDGGFRQGHEQRGGDSGDRRSDADPLHHDLLDVFRGGTRWNRHRTIRPAGHRQEPPPSRRRTRCGSHVGSAHPDGVVGPGADGGVETLRATLLEFRRNYRERRPHWRSVEAIQERYLRACEKLHIGSQYYQLEFGDLRKAPDMSFRKDHYQAAKAEALFGKNVIVTDNHDWTTEEIVQSSLDRYGIEKQFRASKSNHHVQVNPFYHWTDSKIRCQLLSCVIALTVLRLIEITVNGTAGSPHRLSGRQILEEMSHLDSTWLWYAGKRKPQRLIETPTEIQAEVLRAFGWTIDGSGVLQPLGG
jgi:transposase